MTDESTDLGWGVKTSFREYVTRSGGAVSVGAGATWAEEEFRFPLLEASADAVRFRGEAFFQAHGGLLRVMIADPSIEFGDPVLVTVADSHGSSERTTIGVVTGDVVRGESAALTVELTEAGAIMLGGVYATGTPLDDLHVFLPS